MALSNGLPSSLPALMSEPSLSRCRANLPDKTEQRMFLRLDVTRLLSLTLQYGMGAPAPVYNFTNQFDGSLALKWADATNGTGDPSAGAIIAHITSGFNENQLRAVQQVASSADIPSNCPQNFNLFSECYAGIAFNYLPISPTDTTPIDYTISADGGLVYVNVYSHTSDFETRIMPLQLAIDEVRLNLNAVIPIVDSATSRRLSPLDPDSPYQHPWNGPTHKKQTNSKQRILD
jgi:hypothetical protein